MTPYESSVPGVGLTLSGVDAPIDRELILDGDNERRSLVAPGAEPALRDDELAMLLVFACFLSEMTDSLLDRLRFLRAPLRI